MHTSTAKCKTKARTMVRRRHGQSKKIGVVRYDSNQLLLEKVLFEDVRSQAGTRNQ